VRRRGLIDRRIERRVETGDTPEIKDTIRVMVVAVMGGKVRIGIEAPANVTVDHQEVHDRQLGFVSPPCLVDPPAECSPPDDVHVRDLGHRSGSWGQRHLGWLLGGETRQRGGRCQLPPGWPFGVEEEPVTTAWFALRLVIVDAGPHDQAVTARAAGHG
jgi:carbon storage regulator CsrA